MRRWVTRKMQSANARRAVELLPVTKDAWTGLALLTNLAITLCLGKRKRSRDETVGRSSADSRARFPYGQLKLHPFWDSLRDDPRFEKLLEKKPVPLK